MLSQLYLSTDVDTSFSLVSKTAKDALYDLQIAVLQHWLSLDSIFAVIVLVGRVEVMVGHGLVRKCPLLYRGVTRGRVID